jgi:glycosyltransferase involved in cell wall biosynthesis
MRKKLGLPVDAPLVGFCGRTLEAVRGFDIFLKVLRRVWQARPDVQAIAIGTAATLYGNEDIYLGQQSFKEYALAQAGVDAAAILWRDFLPYPTFLGHLACLDLAILPTFEGASNWSFFDAMASGTPILTSNRTYIPELIDYGREGYYFDPYDIDAYARMTLALLDQPAERARIGRNARDRIRREHTPERAADGYERVIYEAVELQRKRRPAGEVKR